MINSVIESLLAGTHEGFMCLDDFFREKPFTRFQKVIGLNGLFEFRFASSSIPSLDWSQMETGIYDVEWADQSGDEESLVFFHRRSGQFFAFHDFLDAQHTAHVLFPRESFDAMDDLFGTRPSDGPSEIAEAIDSTYYALLGIAFQAMNAFPTLAMTRGEGDAAAAKLQLWYCHSVTEAVQANFSVDVALRAGDGEVLQINLLLAEFPEFFAAMSLGCRMDGSLTRIPMPFALQHL